jgi:hypothetical protein
MIAAIIVIVVIVTWVITSVIVNTNIDIDTKETKLKVMQKHNQFCSNCKYHNTNDDYNNIYRDICELTREEYTNPVTGEVTSTSVRCCADNVGSLFTCKWTEC